MEGCTV